MPGDIGFGEPFDPRSRNPWPVIFAWWTVGRFQRTVHTNHDRAKQPKLPPAWRGARCRGQKGGWLSLRMTVRTEAPYSSKTYVYRVSRVSSSSPSCEARWAAERPRSRPRGQVCAGQPGSTLMRIVIDVQTTKRDRIIRTEPWHCNRSVGRGIRLAAETVVLLQRPRACGWISPVLMVPRLAVERLEQCSCWRPIS